MNKKDLKNQFIGDVFIHSAYILLIGTGFFYTKIVTMKLLYFVALIIFMIFEIVYNKWNLKTISASAERRKK